MTAQDFLCKALPAGSPTPVLASGPFLCSQRRGGCADSQRTGGADGVARSASPIGRSLDRRPAKRFAELTTPALRATPLVRGGEFGSTRTHCQLPNVSLAGCIGDCALFVRRSPSVVILVTHVGNVHPRVAHIVNRTVAETDPLIRIGIVQICARVVVPRRNTNHRSFREHGRGIVGIDVAGYAGCNENFVLLTTGQTGVL